MISYRVFFSFDNIDLNCYYLNNNQAMAYLLFPGRHLLNTAFQEEYLWNILRLPIKKLDLYGNYQGDLEDKIENIIFAVTSSNQAHSRYNPIPFFERAIGLDRFAQDYKKNLGINYKIIGIPHFNPNERFTEFTLKEISENTEGEIVLTPQNTIVLCSTAALIEQYSKLGFSILPAEYDLEEKKYKSVTPIEILKKVVEKGEDWSSGDDIKKLMSKSTFEFWVDFPNISKTILRLWNDPLLTETGSLTLDRDYSSYAYGMNNSSLMGLKYDDIKDVIKQGKIVDEGCADGALLVRISEDFPDSDLIGIELTTEFTARCQERLRAGEFGGSFVHFHQRNLLEKVFHDNTIDTTICNSTTHELWSYANQKDSLMGYLQKKYNQTSFGGRLVIRDVVGPENKDEEIYMKLSDTDGSNEDIFKQCNHRDELSEHLSGLSTSARFLRFSEEYLKEMRMKGARSLDSKIIYKEEIINGQKYFVLKLKDAIEFITKKDYVDNWNSELNEEFAYWSFSEWKDILNEIGFDILENPNDLKLGSREYTNPWIVENRWVNKVEFFRKKDDGLELMPFPATNMVLVAEKNKK